MAIEVESLGEDLPRQDIPMDRGLAGQPLESGGSESGVRRSFEVGHQPRKQCSLCHWRPVVLG